MWSQMSFSAAEENFHAGARDGIDARLYWPGFGEVPAAELVLRRLLPLAHEGLERWGVDSSDAARLLEIIERRCVPLRNGAVVAEPGVPSPVRRQGDGPRRRAARDDPALPRPYAQQRAGPRLADRAGRLAFARVADPGTPGSSAYRAAGVDYEALDAGKRNALTEALATSGLLAASGGRAVDESRGEPAFVFEAGGQTLAFVVEGLGTKSIIARQVQEQLGVSAFDNVAYDTVAAIVNDLCCVGAVPLVVNAYFATGSSDWYADEDRNGGLVDGWREACVDAGATWGGGESPSLPGLVATDDIELAGSAVGIVPPGRRPILGADLAAGRRDRDRREQRPSRERLLAGAAGGGRTAGRLPDAAPERAGVRRGVARPDRRCTPRSSGRCSPSDGRGPLPQPHHRARPAEADAPAPRADVHGGAAARGSRGARVPGRADRHVARRRLLDVQHGLRVRRVLRARSRARRWSGSRPGSDSPRPSPAPSRRARAASCSRGSGSCSRAAIMDLTPRRAPSSTGRVEARRRRHRREVLRRRHRVRSHGHERRHEVVHRRRREHVV